MTYNQHISAMTHFAMLFIYYGADPNLDLLDPIFTLLYLSLPEFIHFRSQVGKRKIGGTDGLHYVW